MFATVDGKPLRLYALVFHLLGREIRRLDPIEDVVDIDLTPSVVGQEPMRILFDIFFGFVCHPFVMLSAVLTQLLWSLWMYEADMGKIPFLLHSAIGLTALAVLAVVLYAQSRRRARVRYHPTWTLFHETLFEGQLALGMPITRQLL